MIIRKWFAILQSKDGKVWVSNPFNSKEEAEEFGNNHPSRLVEIDWAVFDVKNEKLENGDKD